MIALRQIQTIEGDFVTIKLPPEFQNYQQAEIIVLPFENSIKKNNTEAFIQRFAGSITDFPEVESLLPEDRDSLE
jgi:TolB-like protein